MTISEPHFCCPLDCLHGIAEVFNGQYFMPGMIPEHVTKPVILDIGANCGAFSIWIKSKWLNATVHAYEPNARLFHYLYRNLDGIPDVHTKCYAVGDIDLNRLYLGNDTGLCGSQYQLGRQSQKTEKVSVLAPEELPRCDLLKIDAEGAEAYIMEHLAIRPGHIVLEFHSQQLLKRCLESPVAKEMNCREVSGGCELGIAHFVR